MSDPFNRGGCGSCNEDECICFTNATKSDDGVITLKSNRGTLCLQAPLEPPITGCLSTVEGGGQALINAISANFDDLKSKIDIDLFGPSTDAQNILTSGSDGLSYLNCDAVLQCIVFDSTVTGSGTSTDPYSVVSTPDIFGPSSDATNILTAGADGLSFLNCDAVNNCVTVVSQDADNAISTGSDGGAFLTLPAPHVPSVSADAGNILNIGTDGETFLDCSAVKGCETLTSLSYDATTTTLTFVDENGDTSLADLSALTNDIFVNGGTFNRATGVLTLTDNDASTPDVTINLGDLVSQLDNNGDGSYTHTSGDGSQTTIQVVSGDANNSIMVGSDNGAFFNHVPSTVTDNGNGTFTHSDGEGNSETVAMGVMSVADGGSNIVDNTDSANPEIRPLLGCDGNALDVQSSEFITVADEFLKPVDTADGCDIDWVDCKGNVVKTEHKQGIQTFIQNGSLDLAASTNTLISFNPTKRNASPLEFGSWNADGTEFTFSCAGIYDINASTTLLMLGITVPAGAAGIGPIVLTMRSRFVFSGFAITTSFGSNQELVGPTGPNNETSSYALSESIGSSIYADVGDTIAVSTFGSTAPTAENYTVLRSSGSSISIKRNGGFL